VAQIRLFYEELLGPDVPGSESPHAESSGDDDMIVIVPAGED